MKADPAFQNLPMTFWANVRSISEKVGYTERLSKSVKVPTVAEMCGGLRSLGLSSTRIASSSGIPTEFGDQLTGYYAFCADVLDNYVRPNLMDVEGAAELFEELYNELEPNCPLPMNKQKGEKKTYAYFTGIVNMLIENYIDGAPCCYDPRVLTSVTRDGSPLRTLSRRVDGAFPTTVNPIAIWEIKEYYYTTTFGSRIADGVYETLLDGMELEELAKNESIDVKHYLMVDAYDTWWNMGRSYLCRIIDMLHMNYLDEALFGREVIERLPIIVNEWITLQKVQQSQTPKLLF